MDVSEKNAKIWRRDITGKNGTFYRYSMSVSKKTQDGKWVSAYLPVQFSKKSGAPEKIDNGALCDFTGFMSVDTFKDREGNTRTQPLIIVMTADFKDMDIDNFETAEEDVPF